MPYVFCTREKTPWCEYAENAQFGPTTKMLQETEFGKIGISFSCHHPLNSLIFGVNGAEIVFNPSAAGGVGTEPLWSIEPRSAAIANGYFTCAVNRVGTEVFENDFTTGDGKSPHRESDYYFGSSYVTAPNGNRSPGLSRTKNGILIVEMDLNLCRQIKDQWGFQMSQRLDLYAELLNRATRSDFAPQIVRKSCKQQL
ncbi:beta-ureidopropionase-like isoform X3 [Diabrotica virgifera virgifera]|uniref:CN hydrolase domain-containing protein n=1 Tax=Diabrotica virgifera virgifera TaxID=50390 RepID=A0ABM5JUF2_DIAVI|nr:beta-ureidopropionase-like isoform X3 [Diabrotica virgifera virgifera]